jgi:diguanylate cyclase (GGDEF)-like protein
MSADEEIESERMRSVSSSALSGIESVSAVGVRRQDRTPLMAASELANSTSRPPLDARIYLVIKTSSLVAVFAHAFLVLFFLVSGFLALAVLSGLGALSWVVARRMNERHRHASAVLVITGEVIVQSSLCVAWLGWESGFQFYLIPLISFVLFYSRGSTPVALGVTLSVIGLFVGLFWGFGQQLSPLASNGLFPLQIMNMVIALFTLALVSFYYRQASFSAEMRMARLATLDPLTGLLNRRRMVERGQEERARAERGGPVFSLVMADIDHFKKVNDTFGHDCGDDVLVEVARRLREGSRDQDIVARWGGEEFLMLLPDTAAVRAFHFTERLRSKLEGEPVFSRGRTISVNASFGVAEFSTGSSLSDVMRRADDALYEAKGQGRNRVVVAPFREAESIPSERNDSQ